MELPNLSGIRLARSRSLWNWRGRSSESDEEEEEEGGPALLRAGGTRLDGCSGPADGRTRTRREEGKDEDGDDGRGSVRSLAGKVQWHSDNGMDGVIVACTHPDRSAQQVTALPKNYIVVSGVTITVIHCFLSLSLSLSLPLPT